MRPVITVADLATQIGVPVTTPWPVPVAPLPVAAHWTRFVQWMPSSLWRGIRDGQAQRDLSFHTGLGFFTIGGDYAGPVLPREALRCEGRLDRRRLTREVVVGQVQQAVQAITSAQAQGRSLIWREDCPAHACAGRIERHGESWDFFAIADELVVDGPDCGLLPVHRQAPVIDPYDVMACLDEVEERVDAFVTGQRRLRRVRRQLGQNPGGAFF